MALNPSFLKLLRFEKSFHLELRILARQKRAEKGITAEQMIEQRRLNGEKRINRAKKMIPAVEIKQETLPPKDELNKVQIVPYNHDLRQVVGRIRVWLDESSYVISLSPQAK